MNFRVVFARAAQRCLFAFKISARAFNVGFAAGSYLLGYVALVSSYPVVFSIAGLICFAAFILLTTVKLGPVG